MKRYITYILATLSLVYIASCTQSDEIANPNDSGRMALLFQSSTMTRSADNTEGLNEDLITSIDCYFYPNGSENSDAVWHYSEDNLTENGSYTISNTLMPAGDMAKIFPSGATQGTMYVIANYTGNDLPSGENLAGSSIAALKQKVVTTTWPQGGSWQAQDSFVMDGQSTISKGEGNAISGTVNLTRAAAKIELTITSIDASVTGTDGCTYVPALNGRAEFGLTMHNAATKSYIDNAWDGSKLAYNADATSGHSSLAGYTFTTDGTQFKQTNPLYSYPTHWGAGPSGEAYLLLVVPWQMTKDANGNDVAGETKLCYYEIPIGKLENNVISEHIARNHHYQISIHVGTLGSFVQEEPVTLTPSYMVVDWTSGTIEAEIKDQQYLVVDETNVEIYNENEYEIGYASSHPVSAVITSVTKPDYSKAEEETITIYSDKGATTVTPSSSISGNKNPFTVSIVNGKVVLSHTLNNDNNSNGFDFVPYDITVVVTNEVGMKQTITYKQYPAIYVENKENSSQTTVDKWNNGSTGTNGAGYGYVMVNSLYANRTNYTSSYSSNKWQTVESFDASSYNPFMYVITTSSLDASLAVKYILGDSREETTYTAQQVGFTAVEDVNGKKLNKYRPTKVDREDYLSPKFRISSAYGQLGDNLLTYQQAKNRCAAYQEDGYPAGRWRLATAAELQYIATLCAKGGLPVSLFGNETYGYWSATVPYILNSDDGTVKATNGSTAWLRCVYDDWYWGSEQLTDRTKYMWGDENTTAELNAKIQ